jgi:hypothetical protein
LLVVALVVKTVVAVELLDLAVVVVQTLMHSQILVVAVVVEIHPLLELELLDVLCFLCQQLYILEAIQALLLLLQTGLIQ